MNLIILLAVLLLIVVISAALHPLMGRNVGIFAAVALAAAGTWAATLVTDAVGNGPLVEHLPWIPTLGVGIDMRLDGLAAVFLLLVVFVGALVMAYSARYFSADDKTLDYYVWMLLFVFSMTGMVLADDLIVLFVFWEFTTLCSFFLINRSGSGGPAAAQRTLLITMAGGLGLLTAALLIIVNTGTSNLTDALASDAWGEKPVFTIVTALLIAFAAFTKSAQFPFHLWLPDAMVAPAPVSAYLHAAAMVKAGIYLMLRFSPVYADVAVWQVTLIAGGLITAVLGAVFAMQRHDIKEIMAYSTVSQLGFLTAVIGVGTEAALTAAIVHVIAHALFKSSLFMMVGVIDHQAHHVRDIRRLRGLRKRMQVSFVVMTLSAMSMAGIPPLMGFVSKEGLFTGFLSLEAGSGTAWLLVVIAATAAVGTFAYCGRLVLGTFTDYTGAGKGDDELSPMDSSDVKEASPLFLAPALLPAAAGLLFGLVPRWLDPLVGSASAAAGGAGSVDPHLLLWHGFTAELAISGAIVTVGLVVVLARASVDRMLPRTLLPFTGVGLIEAGRNGCIALGRRVGDLTRTDVHALHLALPGVFLLVLCITGLLVGPGLGDLDPGNTRSVDWILTLLLALFLYGAARTLNRAAAVVLVGAAGFVVATWFFVLGAVDVGMTQLLVEMMTVVVLVLVLRKLPRRFHEVSRKRTWISGIVAGVFGLMAFLATFGLTGRSERSAATEYYLQRTDEVTGALNVVNSILVDFRALDTLGELTVLGIAGFAILSVLNSAFATSDNPSVFAKLWDGTPLHDPADNTLAMRVLFRWAAPFIALLAFILLVRGHYESGGGFIAALVAAGFVALRYLVAVSDDAAKLRFDYALVTVGGVLTGTGVGLAGFFEGSFLRPITFDIPLPWGDSYHFTSALVFDVGIFLAVIGTVLIAIDRLGQEQRYRSENLDGVRPPRPIPIEPVTVHDSADPGDLPADIDADLISIRRRYMEEP